MHMHVATGSRQKEKATIIIHVFFSTTPKSFSLIIKSHQLSIQLQMTDISEAHALF